MHFDGELDLNQQPGDCLYLTDGLTGIPLRVLFTKRPHVRSGQLKRGAVVMLVTPDARRFPVEVTAARRIVADESMPEPFRAKPAFEVSVRLYKPAESQTEVAATA